MDETKALVDAPPGWLEALAESEAELAAGMTVSGASVRRRLLDSLDRLEASASLTGTRAPR
jgi:hypothetical protein